MKVLIFGRGIIAEKKYLQYLHTAYHRKERSEELETLFIDKNKDGCFDVTNWENESRIPIKEIKKILILSPPAAHLSNFESVVRKFLSPLIQFPEIYIEKPIYLESQEESWLKAIKKDPILEEKVFYIDHYRFKDSIDFFLEEKASILDAIGFIREISFISLEKQEFWNSSAFSRGYFLEHGCHFFGMLDRAFPEIGRCEFIPLNKDDWKKWEQSRRPSKCKEDSAVLLSLKLSGSKESIFSKFEKATIIIGKGMIDKKMFYVGGEKGFCQLFFNENINIIKTFTLNKTVVRKDAKESYKKVAENIFPLQSDPILLMPLRQGMTEQEKVIKIRKNFPDSIGKYNLGEIPHAIKEELKRMRVME